MEESSSRKIYNSLVMVIYLLNIISPENHFKFRLIKLINHHAINPLAMGFPIGWEERPIWVY